MIHPKCKKAHKNITIFGVGITMMMLLFGVTACSIGEDSEPEIGKSEHCYQSIFLSPSPRNREVWLLSFVVIKRLQRISSSRWSV